MPPNILYLNSHDTGRYVQPYGNAMPTPNIQWLADQGVMFRNAFCAAPSCSGSRAALLTGSYCHNNGMMGLAHRGFSLYDYDQHIVRTLRDAGYHTELIGEQHVSATPDTLGYDVVHEIPNTTVSSVAPAAIDALAGEIPQPFFMSVGFFETHRSFFAPSSVRDRVYSLPPPFLPDTPEIRQDVAAYKASARSLDHGVGAVLNTLHETGLDRNTLVICTTDHGLAFPTAKASLLDRGIGVMLIMRGPGMPAGASPTTSSSPRSTSSRRSARSPGSSRRPGCRAARWCRWCRATEEPGHADRDLLRAHLPRRLRAAAGDPHRALQVRAPLRRLSLPGAGQLRRQPEQGRLPGARLGAAAGRPRVAARPVLQPRRGPQLDRRSRPTRRCSPTCASACSAGWRRPPIPLLDGPVPAPPGARINAQDQLSADEPTFTVDADGVVGRAPA